jgi:nitroreductase
MSTATLPSSAELPRLLRRHRSIRRYRSDPVDPALVDEVLADTVAGGYSSGNLNSVSMILTRDAANKQALYELHSRQPMALQAPLIITFCADWWRTRQWLKARGARDNFNNLIGWHVAALDAMIVAQNACLGFEARGLGICYMGTTLHAMTKIAALLNLPQTVSPVTTLVIGWPAEGPPKRDRLPLAALVHHERYRQRSEAELADEYREREVKGWARYMSIPELAERVRELGITSLAQFHTSKAKYDPDVFARDSARLLALLRAQGFAD